MLVRMTIGEFKKSAEFIAKRNVSERVVRVIASFDEIVQHLSVVYIVDSEPCDDDREDCELTCAELIAEFPEIRTAETTCVSEPKHRSHQSELDAVVFSRNSPA